MPEVAHPKMTISGDIGSGKSAVGRLLKADLGVHIYSTGTIQREIAARLGMTTLELNRYAETHPEIDDEIDATSIALGQRDESFLIDSRIAWHFIPHAFKVYLRVDTSVAAQRIFGDTGRTSEAYANVEEAERDIVARRRSEIERFRELYGIDLGDMSNYDLVVDTTERTPEEVARVVLDAFSDWANAPRLPRRPRRPTAARGAAGP